MRNLAIVFDQTNYLALAQDENATLTSAELVFNESFGRDAASGTQSGTITGFFSTEENTGIFYGMTNAGNQGATSGTTGFWGNSGARAGEFGGAGTGGPNNVDSRHTSLSTMNFAFNVGTTEQFTMDLSTGIDLADIKSILADDDVSNAGIYLTSDAPSQIFFTDAFALNLTFDVAAVPEPSSLALLGLAGMGLFVRRVNKQSTCNRV